MDASKSIMGQVAMPQFIAMMAEVLLVGKQPAAAETWLIGALDFEQSRDDLYFSSELHRLSAVCLAARGNTDSARAHLHKALEVSGMQGAILFELRAALTLAEHDIDEARPLLRSALARFPQPEPWPEIISAQQLLR
jgi:tetratricopeptide (TPR) repeat protein